MNVAVKISKKQNYKNLSVFPIINNNQMKLDFIDLKTGLEMGIVSVEECKTSDISHVELHNNSVAPLLLIDGEEIIGSKQNRIINETLIIPPKTRETISVLCSEKGRWEYKSDFKYSNYFANSSTRTRKLESQINNENIQSGVWNSIDRLDKSSSTYSITTALRDTYINNQEVCKDYLKHFKITDNQVGVLVVVNGVIKGIEIFCNTLIYKKYHDSILKSYIIDDFSNSSNNNITELTASTTLENILNANLTKKESIGLGNHYTMSDNSYNGSIVFLDDNLIHAIYFGMIPKYTCEDKINNHEDDYIFDESDISIIE